MQARDYCKMILILKQYKFVTVWEPQDKEVKQWKIQVTRMLLRKRNRYHKAPEEQIKNCKKCDNYHLIKKKIRNVVCVIWIIIFYSRVSGKIKRLFIHLSEIETVNTINDSSISDQTFSGDVKTDNNKEQWNTKLAINKKSFCS